MLDTSKQLKELQDENTRLKTALQTIVEETPNDKPLFSDYFTTLDKEMLWDIGEIARKALNPMCPRCNGTGILAVHNGDDDVPCPDCNHD